MKWKSRKIWSLLIFGTLLAVSASGQNITSTFVGQVNDPSGNGVPSAHITITNTGTGISTNGVADSNGVYTVSGLQAGMYSVSVDAPGFSNYKESGITVQSSQTVRVNVVLKLGSVSETVHVSGAAPLIHTDTSSIEGTADMHQIRDLPATVLTVASLFAAVPGVANPQPPPASNQNIAGTTHWGSVNWSLNGVSVNDPQNGGAAYDYATGTQPPGLALTNMPALDTLQEFRVTDVNSNAEYRDVASVLMVTKQGTNQFHGDLYEFFQNAALNANTFLRNAAGQPRTEDNLNQFGGSIGGPIFKNKAFFFFAPTYLRQIIPGTAQLALPSAAMATGDFKALLSQGTQLYNPYTGQPFLNNQIPINMFAPQSKTLLTYLPAPTVTGSPGLPGGSPNYIANVPERQYTNAYTTRVDYQLTHADSMFGFYSYNVGNPWTVFLGGPPQWGNASNYGNRDQTASATETHIFNPTTLNDFRAAWFIHHTYRIGDNQDFNPSSLFPQLTPGIARGLPTMTTSGYSPMFNDVGDNANESQYSVEFTDNFTKVIKDHTIKTGFDEDGYKAYLRSTGGGLGSFTFTGVWTGNKGWPSQPHSQGNAFADFLLGDTNTATSGTIGPDIVLYNRDYEAYIQDTWQATPSLTLYYGIRYMYQTAWNVRGNARSLYDFTNNKIALPQNSPTPSLPPLANPVLYNAYLPYFETTQSIGLSTNYIHPYPYYWAPRFGFAYRPMNNTVIRGGYGIYHNYLIEIIGGYGSANLPFGKVSQTATSQLPGNPTSTFLPDLTFMNPFGTTPGSIPLNPALNYLQPNLKNAMIQQWSLTLERQFFQNWMARVSYVGSETQHLPWVEEDLNQALTQTPNETSQRQRPRQPWAAILSMVSGAKQSFNQLQLEAIRRFSNGASFQAEYSWTRSLDNVEATGGPQQVYRPQLDYGNTTGARTQNLALNYLYELPFGHGKPWLSDSSSLVNAFVGGWQVAGITNYYTGAPFSVTFEVPSSYVGWAGGRADRIPGVPLYNRQSGHNIINGVSWFNTAAFGPPQPWTYGNSGRNILWGPGYWNWDISVQKQVPVFKHVNTIARADFLDAFNHFNLGQPNAVVASPQYGGLPEPTAGKIFTGSGFGSGNRQIQLSLRVVF